MSSDNRKPFIARWRLSDRDVRCRCIGTLPAIIVCTFFIIPCDFCHGMVPPYYGIDRPSFEYELPPLEFGFSELEPYIDEETVRVHYLGHHSKYTEKMNAALNEWRLTDKHVSRKSIVEILKHLSEVPDKWRTSLRNNGGGFVNHNIYWSVLSPNPEEHPRLPTGNIAEEISKKWDSLETFKVNFNDMANTLFGSGYVWLCRNYTEDKRASELLLTTTTNQDSPLSQNLYPLLVIDVWEHAYYLKYRNQRQKYVDRWWNIVDWDSVTALDQWWQNDRKHEEL